MTSKLTNICVLNLDYGQPVGIGSLKNRSGSLHADIHGLQSIPMGVAAPISTRENSLISLCQSAHFSIEKLRSAVAGEAAEFL